MEEIVYAKILELKIGAVADQLPGRNYPEEW